METYIVMLFSSCILALLLTPSLRDAAIENGVLDQPNERKIHKKAVPRVGGIAIVISFFVSITMGYALFRPHLYGSIVHFTGFCIGAMVIFVIGIWDDLWSLNARSKLLGQIAAALILIPFGFVIQRINLPFVGAIDISWQLGIPLTIFWIVGIVNTINFIDGLDGLAAGVIEIIAAALFIVSVINNQILMAVACLVTVGSALGFLRYNFNPASIFMGDCGAMFLGTILAAVSVIVFFQRPSEPVNSLVPILVFGLPIVDTTWTIFRRIRKRKSPFHADSSHTHHRLMDLGLTQRQVAVTLYIVSLIFASMGIIIALTGSEMLTVILFACFLIAALAGVTILGRKTSVHRIPGHRIIQPSESSHAVIRRMYKMDKISKGEHIG